MQLHQSEENYLKAILLLHLQKTDVRKVDIAELMGYTKASVSCMVKKLTERNYAKVIAHNVCLTEMGLEVASKVYERNTIVQNFLIDFLKITPQTAEKDANHMEHIISDETFEALKTITRKV